MTVPIAPQGPRHVYRSHFGGPRLGRMGEGETPLLSTISDANGKHTEIKTIAQANLESRLTEERSRGKPTTTKLLSLSQSSKILCQRPGSVGGGQLAPPSPLGLQISVVILW